MLAAESVNVEEEQNIVASNSVYGFLRSGSKFIASFLLSILFVRILGPTNYGIYTVAVLYWGFAATFSSLGLNSTLSYSVARYRAQEKPGMIKWVLKHYLKVLVLSSFIAAVVLFMISGPLASAYRTPELAELLRILAIGLVFYSLNENFVNPIFTGKQKLKYGFITGVTYDAFRIVQLIVVYIGFKLIGAITVYDVTYLAVATLGLFFVYRLFKSGDATSKPDKAEVKHLRHYSGFSYVGSLIGTISGPVITLFLGFMAPNISDVSFYRVGLIMVGMLGLPASAMGSSFFASITKFFEKKDMAGFYNLQRKLLKYSVLVTIPLVVASLIAIRPLIGYLYRFTFIGVQYPFMIMLIPIVLSSIFGPITQILSATGKQKYWMYSTVSGSLAGIVSTLVLVPRFFAIGAAEAYVIVNITVLVLNLMFLKRLGMVSIHKSLPYLDLLKGFIAVTIMGVFLYYAINFITNISLLPLILISGLVVYFFVLYSIKGITKGDIRFFIKLLRADKFVRMFYKR